MVSRRPKRRASVRPLAPVPFEGPARTVTASCRAGTAIVVALACGLAVPPTAPGDTARVTWSKAGTLVVVTTDDGTKRRIGPVDVEAALAQLRVSPDHRYLAIAPGASTLDAITIVPLDGGPPRKLHTGSARLRTTDRTRIWWSADSREVVVGGTAQVAARWNVPSPVLRCALDSGTATGCQTIPEADGVAATVPGAVITSTAAETLLPFYPSVLDLDQPLATWPLPNFRVPRSASRRLRPLQVPRTARTVLVTDAPRALRSTTTSLAQGFTVALDAVSGPTHALIVQQDVRTRIAPTAGGHEVQYRRGPLHWALIDATGVLRTVPAARVRVPKRLSVLEGAVARHGTQVTAVEPTIPLPAGGWLGLASDRNGDGIALTRTAPDGRSRVVRSRGRVVTATDLVRTVVRRRAVPGSASMAVVGYEATTRAAVVALHWTEDRGRDTDRYPRATVRVPLDGHTAPRTLGLTAEREAW